MIKVFNLFHRSAKNFFSDDGPQWAAAIAYYALLSIFPVFLAVASIASFFIDPDWAVEQGRELLSPFIPQGETQIAETVREAVEARSSVSILSLGALLWSGSRVFATVTRAINIAFKVEDTYSFLKRTFFQLAMLLTIGMLFIVAFASRFVLRTLISQNNWIPANESFLISLSVELVSGLLLLTAFFLVFRFVPRRRVATRSILVGSVLAVTLFFIARPLFLNYVQKLSGFNLIYGPIAVMVILIVWAWVISMILIYSAEVVNQFEILWEKDRLQDTNSQSNTSNTVIPSGVIRWEGPLEGARHDSRQMENPSSTLVTYHRWAGWLIGLGLLSSVLGVVFVRLRKSVKPCDP